MSDEDHDQDGGAAGVDDLHAVHNAAVAHSRRQLDAKMLKAHHAALKATDAWKSHGQHFKRRTGRPPVPELLVSEMRRGGSQEAEMMISEGLNELIVAKFGALDGPERTFAELPGRVEAVVGHYGHALTWMWAGWRPPEEMWAIVGLLLARHSDGQRPLDGVLSRREPYVHLVEWSRRLFEMDDAELASHPCAHVEVAEITGRAFALLEALGEIREAGPDDVDEVMRDWFDAPADPDTGEEESAVDLVMGTDDLGAVADDVLADWLDELWESTGNQMLVLEALIEKAERAPNPTVVGFFAALSRADIESRSRLEDGHALSTPEVIGRLRQAPDELADARLDALLSVEATSDDPDAAAAVDLLRDAAREAREAKSDVAPLHAVHDVLASHSSPGISTLRDLEQQLPGPLQPVAWAIATGSLRLPDSAPQSDGVSGADREDTVAAPREAIHDGRQEASVTENHQDVGQAIGEGQAGTTTVEPATASSSKSPPTDETRDPEPTDEPDEEEKGPAPRAVQPALPEHADSGPTGDAAVDTGPISLSRDQADDSDPTAPSMPDGVASASPQPATTTSDDDQRAARAREPASSELTAEQIADTLTACLKRQDWGAAYWVAAAAGMSERADAAKVLAYADAMRRGTGPATTAFVSAAAEADPETIAHDPIARLLLLTANIRATLVRPHLASPYLAALCDHLGDQPRTQTLVQVLIEVARNNVSLDNAAPRANRTDGEAIIADAATRVSDAMEKAATAKSMYAGATKVLHMWVEEEGRLGQLLTTAALDDRSQAGRVTKEIVSLRRTGALDRLIDQTDPRPSNSDPIDGRARRWLISNGNSLLDAAEEWADAVKQHQTTGSRGYAEAKLEKIHHLISSGERDRLFAELAEGAGDPVAEATCVAVRARLDDLFDRILQGRPFRGADADPAVALSGALLGTSIPLDIDTLEPNGGLAPDDVLALAKPSSLSDAFDRRARDGDIDEAIRIVELLAADASAEREAALRQRLDEAATEAHNRARDAWHRAQRELLSARRQGWLGPDAAQETERLLEAAAIKPERTDLGRAQRSIDRMRTRIADARKRRIAEVSAELDRRAATNKRIDAHRDRIKANIDGGDTFVAEEMMRLLDEGEDLAVAERIDRRFNGVYSRVIDERATHPIDLAAVEAARERGSWGAIDFSELNEQQAVSAAEALQAWMALAPPDKNQAAQRSTGPDLLRSVLRQLGLEPQGSDAIVHPDKRGGQRHYWWELRDFRVRDSLVPQFGSQAAVYRLLLVWPGMSAKAVCKTVADDGDRRPTIALIFEPLAAEKRRDFACQIAQTRVPLLLIDSTTFAYRASLSDELWGTTLWLTLPYTAVNPYVRRGTPPEEMFYGRRDALNQLLDLNGPAVVTAGRQLGKTTILRYANDRFNRLSDAVAVYHSIPTVPAEEAPKLWTDLRALLIEGGVQLPAPDRDHNVASAVQRGMAKWLADNRARRVLILIDEADTLLRTDRESGFRTVQDLKRLMEDSPGQAKVVLCGLETVQRFSQEPNQPFAHLAGTITIGGLAPQGAHDLIHRPMQSLGYTFESPDLVTRICGYANYGPAILQEFGYALIEHMVAKRDGEGPAWQVTDDDVETVYNDPELATEIRKKFRLTLDLDPYYSLVAHTMALRAHDEYGARSVWTLRELREEARSWWPAGFEERYTRADQFRVLLDEMVGLGVLAKTDGGYSLLNGNVQLLLGTREEVEMRLLEFADRAPTVGYQADLCRRPMRDQVTLSPLTDRQLGQLVTPHDAPRLLLGSGALGLDLVEDVIEQRTYGLRDVMFKSHGRPYHTKDGRPELPNADQDIHRIVGVDVSGMRRPQVQRATERAHHLTLEVPHAGSAAVIVLIDPSYIELWRTLAAGDDPTYEPYRVDGLQRLDDHALLLWADAIDQPLRSSQVEAVLEHTSGWPLLLNRAAGWVSEGRERSLDEAAYHVGEWARTAGAGTMAKAIGLPELDEPARQTFQAICELGSAPVEDFDAYVAELVFGALNEDTLTRAAIERELLNYLQIVQMTGSGKDSVIRPEPIAAAVTAVAAAAAS